MSKSDFTCQCIRALLVATGVALLLAGCAGSGSYQSQPGVAETRRYAEDLSMRGDHAGAARQYLDISNRTAGDTRNRFLILAARELYLSNDLSNAQRILAEVGNSVSEINLALWAMVSAEVQLANQQPQQALRVLERIPPTDPDANSPRVLLLQSKALFQMGEAEAGVRKLIERDAILRSAKDKAANQRNMYLGLQSAGASIPSRPRTADQEVNGWLVLGYITWQQRGDASALRNALLDWRTVYPDHPAATVLVPELLAELGTLLNYPGRVALLLPLSGRQKATAEAVRDGFLAAHFALNEIPEQPEVMIYDSATDPVAAYEKALRDGADFVVGPLLKNAVTDVALYPDRVTTLTLNTLADPKLATAGLYQYALAPEDEARQVARRAVSEGRLNGLVLLPDTDWGSRILTSFAEELSEYDGAVIDYTTYAPDSPDYSVDIKRLLLLSEADARHQNLNRTIGTNTGYEPRIREDADFIFIVANSKDGGMLRPQLRFHYAGALPVYATSAIYQPGSRSDTDKNDIEFPDSPWVIGKVQSEDLDTALRDYWGAGAKRRQRFIAMGHDAYRLLPMLHEAEQPIEGSVNGLSGKLTVDEDGKIERKLTWAQIRRGRPYPLAETPQLIEDNPESALLPQQ